MLRWLACLALTSAPATASATAPAADDWRTVERIVAIVNDDLVLARELDRRVEIVRLEVDRIPDPAERTRRQTNLREAVLQAIVDDLLFAQAAAAAAITVEDTEVDRAIAAVKTQYALDDEAFTRALADTGMSLPEYRADLRRQLLRMKTFNILLRTRIDIPESRVRAAYDRERQQNPSLGDYDSQSERLRAALFEQTILAEADKWLVTLRRAAHVELRP